MDPTAQANPQDSGNAIKSPILPGQFVVAGEDSEPRPMVSQTPASPDPALAAQISDSLQQEPLPQVGSGTPPVSFESQEAFLNNQQVQTEVAPQGQSTQTLPPLPQVQLQPEQQTLPPTPQVEPPKETPIDTQIPVMPTQTQQDSMPQLDAQPVTPTAPTYDGQPDPTPFAPPTQKANAQSGGPGGKLKGIMIVLILLILAGAAAAATWYFVLPKIPQAAKTAILAGAGIEDPPQIPKRKSGGFGDLPAASQEATAGSASSNPR